MKKNFKYIIIGVLVLLMPSFVSAATLTVDSENKQDDSKGTVKMPIYIEVKENENITSFDLDCNCGGDLEATCKIEGKTNGNAIYKDKAFLYIESGSSKSFPTGKTELGYVIIQNKIASKRLIPFKISNKTASITNLSDEYKANVSAKEEERVPSHDATLKSLKPSKGTMSPEFSPNVYEYTVYGIADTINSVNINWDCTVTNTCNPSIPGNNGSRKVNLKQGENRVEIVVESEVGDEADTKTYVLNIIRGENGFNSAKLASLSFGEYTLTPAFKSDVKEYTLTVPNNVTSVVNVLKFDKQDPKATESLNGFDNFIVGENKATITIDNVNGDETITYTITITRMNDTDIEVLKYKDGEITFRDSEGIQTVLTEDEFKSQYVDEWKKIEDKTYTFDEDGNIVKASLKDDTVEEPKKKSNSWIIIVIIVVGLLIIGISGFFIFKKKKPTDEEGKENKEERDLENGSDNEEEAEKITKDENKKNKDEEEIDESDIEEEAIKKEKKKDINSTMEIDEALVDLMSTKKYDFKDED